MTAVALCLLSSKQTNNFGNNFWNDFGNDFRNDIWNEFESDISNDFVNDFENDLGVTLGMTLGMIWEWLWYDQLFYLTCIVLHKRIGPISMHSAIGNCIRDTLDSAIGQSSLPL